MCGEDFTRRIAFAADRRLTTINEFSGEGQMSEISGIFVLNKGEGMTSQSAVNRVKRLFGAEKAGHTGTLDPMATGVLPVLLGRAVKASEFMLSSDKQYRATLRLGLTTDTEDTTGAVLTRADRLPTAEEALAAADAFRGEILQVPPMYSALKQNGKKLVDLARAGITVEREPRRITVHRLTLSPLSESDYDMEVVCSKGTYIRTLCADIGASLGVGGVMASLCRLEAAGFSLAEAHTLEELEGASEEERRALLVPVERVFSSLPTLRLPPFFARLARNGAPIYQRKIGVSLPAGSRVRVADENGFFAVAESREAADGMAFKVLKLF